MFKKKRWLIQTLVLSAALNVVLFGIFFYFLIRDNPLHFSFQPKQDTKLETTVLNASFLAHLHTLSFEQLIELLDDKCVVEQGYRLCDFALGVLVGSYEFDVLRALGYKELPQRQWLFGETVFTLYPSLTNEAYAKCIAFARQERFPYTIKGILQKIEHNETDADLLIYFCHSPEFLLLETLFARAGAQISKGTLLKMVCEGGYERLMHFYVMQTKQSNFSAEVRQRLLLDYIEGGSKMAAYLLLITDFDYALNQLEDRHVICVLDVLDVKTEEAIRFTHQIASSPRRDHIKKHAYQKLSEYVGDEVAGHYVPRPSEGELRPVFREAPPAAPIPAPATHTVQPGESLWLIARKYGVSVEYLMEFNHLQSTVIRPGKVLRIPL